MSIEIEMSELSEMNYRGLVVSKSRFLGRTKLPNVCMSSMNFNSSQPSFIAFIPTNTLEAAGVERIQSLVAMILKGRSFSEIISSIIQSVMVPMISLFFSFTAKNQSVHVNRYSALPSASVERFHLRIPICEPIPLRKPLEIAGIDNRVLTLRKRDKAVRFIERLNNRVAFHMVFHRSTSNGLLEFSRYFSTELSVN